MTSMTHDLCKGFAEVINCFYFFHLFLLHFLYYCPNILVPFGKSACI